MVRRATRVAEPVTRPKTLLPHNWRDLDQRWRVTAMLAKIPGDDYLTEARAFESHHICHQTLSDDWAREWHAWCFGKLTGKPVAPPPPPPAVRQRPRRFG